MGDLAGRWWGSLDSVRLPQVARGENAQKIYAQVCNSNIPIVHNEFRTGAVSQASPNLF